MGGEGRRLAAADSPPLPSQVIGFDPVVSEAAASAAGIRKVTLDELWGSADFVTLHTPLNAATRHVVNAATLAKCRKGVFVINAARGGVVDEAALLAALEVRCGGEGEGDRLPPPAPVCCSCCCCCCCSLGTWRARPSTCTRPSRPLPPRARC